MEKTNMKTSEQTAEIDSALSMAQGELDPAPKSSINPHYKSRYADYATCREVAKSVLAKHGLSVTQGIVTDIENMSVGVITRLAHKSGQWILTETWCKPKGIGPQDIGSAGSYLKRYGFSAAIGLVSEEDDDGNSAQGKNEQPKKEQPKPQQKPVPNTQLSSDFYTGTSVQEKAVAEILCKHGVPDQDFELIHQELMNKPKKFLFDVILKRYEAR
jgi:hypothetical protein